MTLCADCEGAALPNLERCGHIDVYYNEARGECERLD